MFRNVVIGIDEHARRADAVELAGRLVAADGMLTLANVHTAGHGRAMTSAVAADGRQRSQQLLARAAHEFGIRSTEAVAAATVGQGLRELATRRGADLLVLSSSRHGALGRVRLGDDTRESLNGAPCAVAVAPAGYADALQEIRTVGVGYNETRDSERALEAARELAESGAAELSLFESVAFPTYAYWGLPAIDDDTFSEGLNATLNRLNVIDGVGSAHAAYGEPADQLTEYSTTVDLLVVGSRGYGPLGRLVHSSTSARLSLGAHCPLLVVPRAAASRTAHDQAPTAAIV